MQWPWVKTEDLRGRPQKLRWGTAHAYVPPIFCRNTLYHKKCPPTLCMTYHIVIGFQAKYDEMTKKSHQEFWL